MTGKVKKMTLEEFENNVVVIANELSDLLVSKQVDYGPGNINNAFGGPMNGLLVRMGDKFDIFVGQVGCWCPWSPNPEDLQDQEYAETELNTLMKKYKENSTQRDLEFEQRKQEKIDKVNAELAAKKLEQNVSNITISEEQEQPTSEEQTSEQPSSE